MLETIPSATRQAKTSRVEDGRAHFSRQVAGDGPLRRLFPPRDAAALREAVERLLADPELRERLGSAAGARASLGWDDVIERTLEVYRGALEA